MPCLDYLRQYGSGSSDSEVEFCGFDLENHTGERFLQKTPPEVIQIVSSQTGSCEAGKSAERRKSETETTNLDRPACNNTSRSRSCDSNSSCSFFEQYPQESSRKKTRKEMIREDSAKKRRLSHAIILRNCGCLKNCNAKFTRDDRLQFHETFWNLDNVAQGNLIRQYAHLIPVRRRRKRNAKDLTKRLAYTCTLPSSSGDPVVVCRKFFLNTVGFGEHCGCVRGAQDGPREYQRGKYKRNNHARETIKEHIFGYGPTISHYRRAHAPNRLYLPSDLTEKSLHKNYEATQNLKVSYSLYFKDVKQCNISFVKLGHEQCETCVAAEQHRKVTEHSDAKDCTWCSEHSLHLKRASESRIDYRVDGNSTLPNQVELSVDLQKVIQLPRLNGFKSIMFSQRLLVFNETFAPVGAYARSFPVSACIWSESISGRTANEILSCFFKVIKKYSHLQKITFWLDNCSSQNKNWNLFQHIILLINSEEIQVEQILFKFFESGHTFMAADSFHAAVESKMRHERVVTFEHFKSVVGSAKTNVDVLDMKVTDFFQAKFNVSQYTLNLCKPRPYVDNMRKVVFQKGCYELGYASNINSEDLQYCKLFSKKQLQLIEKDTFSTEANVLWQKSPRGIEVDRKASLMAVVVPVVTEEEKSFLLIFRQSNKHPNSNVLVSIPLYFYSMKFE